MMQELTVCISVESADCFVYVYNRSSYEGLCLEISPVIYNNVKTYWTNIKYEFWWLQAHVHSSFKTDLKYVSGKVS